VPPLQERPSFAELTRVFLRVGLLSFGGPAGQIAMMHKELVDERRWISDARFLHALNYCMLLPGPEAQQLATYVGWLLHRTPGALVAGGLFVLPGFFTVLALSAVYAAWHRVPAIEGALFGLKAAVVAIVFEALIRVGKRALKTRFALAVAILAFLALAVFAVPFPIVVLAAAGLGVAMGPRAGAPSDVEAKTEDSVIDAMAARGELAHATPSVKRALGTAIVFVAAWLAPLAIAALVLGGGSVHVTLGVFFSKMALVTFGGAYAALAYVAQEAVQRFAWLTPGEMVDGLGLAETTPGPLILVLEFVGYVAAYRSPGALSPWASGLLGAAMTVWATFTPCFLFVLVGAPWIESLRKSVVLTRALSAVTAAVVGVVANLTTFFTLHALFRRVTLRAWGIVRVEVPDLASIDPAAAALSVVALVAALRFKTSVPKLVASFAAAGIVVHLLSSR
jgi:chromate transporter